MSFLREVTFWFIPPISFPTDFAPSSHILVSFVSESPSGSFHVSFPARDSPKGNHKGCFIIPTHSFPMSHRSQVEPNESEARKPGPPSTSSGAHISSPQSRPYLTGASSRVASNLGHQEIKRMHGFSGRIVLLGCL